MSDELQFYDATEEMAVLACCLQAKSARERAQASMTGADFYSPSHEEIWDAMMRLDRQGMAVDPVSLRGVVAHKEGLVRIVIDLLGYPVAAENVDTHARTVRLWATKRRMWTETERLRQEIFRPNVDVIGLAASTANRFAAVRDAGAITTDIEALTVEELMLEVDDEPDWIIPGFLERGDRFVLTGEEGLGKALALDTPIPTPTGWTTMRQVAKGSWVFDADGRPTVVQAVTEVMQDRPCYRVIFHDGTAIIADEQHQWITKDYVCRRSEGRATREGAKLKPRGTDQKWKCAKPGVRTTGEIAATLYTTAGRVNHSVDLCGPLRYDAQVQIVDPYVLGAWLGDGHSKSSHITLHEDDHEILDRIEAAGVPVRKGKAKYLWALGDGKGGGKRGDATFLGRLRILGVYGAKHIPEQYLHASVIQRMALLQGLMDTDGTIGKGVAPTCEFSVTNERLARDVHELVLGLGIRASFTSGPAKIDGREVGTRYRVAFQTDQPVFHLSRKAERIKPLRTPRSTRRFITQVERIESVPVKCIQVEGGMYLAGRECVPTHNSHLLRQIVILASAGLNPFKPEQRIEPIRGMVIDFENTKRQIRRRLAPTYLFAQRGRGQPGLATILPMPRSDVTADRVLSKLHRELDACQPDVLAIGPLYKMSNKALQDDTDAGPVLAALDTIRERGIALLIEAHAGHTRGSHNQRDLRPRGSSALLGWPEFGYGMKRTSQSTAALIPWRGDRDVRSFPTSLMEVDGRWEEQRHTTIQDVWRPKQEWGDLERDDE